MNKDDFWCELWDAVEEGTLHSQRYKDHNREWVIVMPHSDVKVGVLVYPPTEEPPSYNSRSCFVCPTLGEPWEDQMDEKESKPNILQEAEALVFGDRREIYGGIKEEFEAQQLMVNAYIHARSAQGLDDDHKFTMRTEDFLALDICRALARMASAKTPCRGYWTEIAGLAQMGAVLQGLDEEPDPDHQVKDEVMKAMAKKGVGCRCPKCGDLHTAEVEEPKEGDGK